MKPLPQQLSDDEPHVSGDEYSTGPDNKDEDEDPSGNDFTDSPHLLSSPTHLAEKEKEEEEEYERNIITVTPTQKLGRHATPPPDSRNEVCRKNSSSHLIESAYSFNTLISKAQNRRLSVPHLRRSVKHAVNHQDIFGESTFRARMRKEYPLSSCALAFLFQLLFFGCVLTMLVLFCMKVHRREANVSRERLLWYGYATLPDVAVVVHNYAGTKHHFSVRAQKKYIKGIDYAGRVKVDIPLTRCDLRLNGDEVQEGAYCFPKGGDDMVVGQTFGQSKYRYVEISIDADTWPIADAQISLYVKNYVDMHNWIWDSHYYNINSGWFSMSVEIFFTKVGGRNFLNSSFDMSSFAGAEEFELGEEKTYMRTENSYQRMRPFDREEHADPGVDDKIEVMSFYLRSSLYLDDEKYTRYSVTNLFEDIGGLATSVMVVLGLVFTACLCCLDQIGTHYFNHHVSPPKSPKDDACANAAVLDMDGEYENRLERSRSGRM